MRYHCETNSKMDTHEPLKKIDVRPGARSQCLCNHVRGNELRVCPCNFTIHNKGLLSKVYIRGCVRGRCIPGRLNEEKKEEISVSRMTKAPTPTDKSKTQRDNTKTPRKTSITQRLRTDLGRSVGVTIATQLVWLNRFTRSQPTH